MCVYDVAVGCSNDVSLSGHEGDRYRSRSFHHPSPHNLLPWYDCPVAKRTIFIVTPKPLVKTLGVECVRASQTAYLRTFIELVEAYCTYWVNRQQRFRMFLLLRGLPVVERFSLDAFLKLLSSQLHALCFLCRLNIMRQTRQEVRPVTVTQYQKCH